MAWIVFNIVMQPSALSYFQNFFSSPAKKLYPANNDSLCPSHQQPPLTSSPVSVSEFAYFGYFIQVDILRYLSFSVQLTVLTTMFSGSIHIVIFVNLIGFCESLIYLCLKINSLLFIHWVKYCLYTYSIFQKVC